MHSYMRVRELKVSCAQRCCWLSMRVVHAQERSPHIAPLLLVLMLLVLVRVCMYGCAVCKACSWR